MSSEQREEKKRIESTDAVASSARDPFLGAVDVACIAKNVQEQAIQAEQKARYAYLWYWWLGTSHRDVIIYQQGESDLIYFSYA